MIYYQPKLLELLNIALALSNLALALSNHALALLRLPAPLHFLASFPLLALFFPLALLKRVLAQKMSQNLKVNSMTLT